MATGCRCGSFKQRFTFKSYSVKQKACLGAVNIFNALETSFDGFINTRYYFENSTFNKGIFD